MVPYPEPSHSIILIYPEGTISKGYSKRPNMFLVIDTLEMQGKDEMDSVAITSKLFEHFSLNQQEERDMRSKRTRSS